jgi:hypothetical protein
MKYTAVADDTPARAYGRSLLQLHDLIARGQGDDPKADTIRDEMDVPWHAMTGAEQERVGGLSEDLYALAENNPRSVKMSAEERNSWGRAFGAAFEPGDWDRVLLLLRKPPDDVPPDHVAFFQAESWEHLGCPEIALRFMRSATRLNAGVAMSVLTLWRPSEAG